ERNPGKIRGPAPALDEHADPVVPEDGPASSPGDVPADRGVRLAAPLDGVRVLDLGAAVAGPFGTQVLSDLGADVVKVNTLTDQHWHSNHVSWSCNRGKRSIAIDLKDPRGLAILHRLVETADVVHSNMRYDALRRLGADYETLRAINPRLVY